MNCRSGTRGGQRFTGCLGNSFAKEKTKHHLSPALSPASSREDELSAA